MKLKWIAEAVALSVLALQSTPRDAAAETRMARALEAVEQGRNARIFGGAPVDLASPAGNDWGFVGSLQNSAGEHFCGVSLMRSRVDGFSVDWAEGKGEPDIAITAAHCVVTIDGEVRDPETLQVFSAQSNLSDREKAYFSRITDIIVHPGYDEELNNDIAVLGLLPREDSQPTANLPKLIRPPELWISPFYQETTAELRVSGWGATETNFFGSDQLLSVSIPYSDQEACQRNYGRLALSVNESAFCAGFATGRADSCQGDSGGGMIFDYPSLLGPVGPFLVGVVSWGEGCAEPGLPGVYTDVLRHMSWVEAVAVELDQRRNASAP